MKLIENKILLVFFVFSYVGFSQTDTSNIRKFSITFVPIELGITLPINSNKISQDPINAYVSHNNENIHANVLRIGLLYKNKFGFESFYNFSSGLEYTDSYLKDYLSTIYPNYESPKNMDYTHSSEFMKWKGWQAAIYYRIKIKNFYIDPKFQIGIETISQRGTSYYLKEKGSNHFVNYYLNSESLRKYTPSYHYIINFSRRMNPNSTKLILDVGFKFEFEVLNLRMRYTIIESQYGFPTKYTDYNSNQALKVFIIGTYFKLFY